MYFDCNIYYVLLDNFLLYFNINYMFCLKVKIEMLKERVIVLKE